MRKINMILWALCFSLAFLLSISQVFAKTKTNIDIKITDDNFIWPQFSSMGLERFMPHGENIQTIDPNFKDTGIADFTGIRIKKLLELSGISPENGITIIGSDQYVGYLSRERISQGIGLLAWEMNGKPIQKIKGGPLKIIFPAHAGINGSCYTWYVDTIIAGSVYKADLTVQVHGNETRYTIEELASHARKMDPSLLSIPQGCRNEFTAQQLGKTIYAVTLTDLIKPAGLKAGERIRLIPFAGPAMDLAPAIFNYPIFIIISHGGKTLHPALGGPFSVIFPVEDHPGLTGLVPDSGALFFLEKIVVE